MPTNNKPIETISQLADKVLKGSIKLGDVPEFRRKPVKNMISIAKPDAIASMASRDLARSSDAPAKVGGSKKEPSRFQQTVTRNVRSS